MRAYQIILAASSDESSPRRVMYTKLTDATSAEVRQATRQKYPDEFIVDIRAMPKRTPIY